ncbi:MAG: VOC family protein [Fimbriimonadaceae bacterium]|nr:VOC family protein [Fimbriimonadaceae bacterium]
MSAPPFQSARIVLAVVDLASSTDFYLNVLGFQRDFGDGSDGWSFLSRGAVRFMLGECRDERPASELGNHSYIAHILMDDVDAYFAEIVARGAVPYGPPQDKPWGIREFGLATPDGHRMTFGSLLA